MNFLAQFISLKVLNSNDAFIFQKIATENWNLYVYATTFFSLLTPQKCRRAFTGAGDRFW